MQLIVFILEFVRLRLISLPIAISSVVFAHIIIDRLPLFCLL